MVISKTSHKYWLGKISHKVDLPRFFRRIDFDYDFFLKKIVQKKFIRNLGYQLKFP